MKILLVERKAIMKYTCCSLSSCCFTFFPCLSRRRGPTLELNEEIIPGADDKTDDSNGENAPSSSDEGSDPETLSA